ncbi:MAG: hypothetical protein ACRESX_06570 [Gammaproteobacteria bacterium]
MNIDHISNWLDQHIWPQIQTMMLRDAYFKLMGYAHKLTGEFNGPIGELIQAGYVTMQTVTIRRLCDGRRDVISLRRALMKAKEGGYQTDEFLSRLDSCDNIRDLVNDHVAHTANPDRKQNINDWNLQALQLTEAQKAICEVAVKLDRDLLQRRICVALIPVPQLDIMQDFRSWVPDAKIGELYTFWHSHNKAVNAWTRSD